MKKAKEMFEELGYKKYSDDNITISYKQNAKTENINMVVFYFIDRTYQVYSFGYSSRLLRQHKYCPIYEPYRITREMHKAINKQCEELGWFDE